MLCQLVFQPVIRLIQIVVSVIEYVLVQICRLIQELVQVVTQVLKYICNTVVRTVCGAVCSVICGICDFFCGIFGCDCGCRNICNNICKTVTAVVCGWTYILETILQYVTRLVCSYILQAFLVLLHLIEAIVVMVLTWICSLIDIVIRWFLCWTYVADIFNSRKQRRFRVAPKIVPNGRGHSAWFVYVNNPTPAGSVDQSVQGYILSDAGRPLVPEVSDSGEIAYFEVQTRGDVITGELRTEGKEPIRGRPFLYYPSKVMEIASHLFGDIFGGDPADDGRGTDFQKNLLSYIANVQAWLDADGKLPTNNYNVWSGKYTTAGGSTFFGDRSISDMGLRVDTDSTCSRPTNTFLHLVDDVSLTAGNTDVAEGMTCGAGQTLTLDETNFLMLNKGDASAVTTYFVSHYDPSESSVGCNDLLGYTVISFSGGSTPLFVSSNVLAFHADTNRMMSTIVENISGMDPAIVRVAETYLHECGHQCGLLHDEDKPDCENDATLHISKVMNPGGSVRRAFTRFQWCMVRTSAYMTGRSLTPFTQAAELPDSGSVPNP